MRTRLLIVLAWSLGQASCWGGQPARSLDAKQTEFFESRIRPILAEHCFSCHGPKKQSAELRLDSRAALLAGNEDGPVIVVGEPEKSRLIHAVRRSGKLKMPPKEALPAQAVADLTAWVKMGAPWPETKVAGPIADDAWKKHWAFQPVRTPAVPNVRDGAWPLTAIDRFILAKLEEKGLRPSPAADRPTLIRRATFDLIGLPPTPEEVAAFEADRSPDAFAKVVDRLLASPHYGERWGRHWLDVARYSDTKGYVFFEESPFPWAYTYRDYVIRAFNEDLPYNRFIVEQVAADYLVRDADGSPVGAEGPASPLPEPDRRIVAAMGFLTVGGRFMNNVHDILDDRIDVVTRGLLGLTVTCARCHDHKYDPIPSKDYYSLYGVFASSVEPTVPPLFLPEPTTDAYAKFDKELKLREQKLMEFVRQKHEELTSGARTRAAEYLLAAHALRDQPSTEEFMLLSETNELNPTMIVRWQKYLERARKKQDPVFAAWHAFAALPEKEFAAQAARVASKLGPMAVNPLVAKVFADPPKSMKDIAQRYGELLNRIDKRWHDTSNSGALPDAAEEELRQVFHGSAAPPNVAMLPYGDLSLLPDRPSQAKLQELRKELEKWRASGPAAPPRAMVLEDLPTPVEPRVFLRGNPNNPGEAVPRRFLSVLARDKRAPFVRGSGRLELARAIASRDNPLTARVLVNRLWHHHFGAGLVRTPSDFGLRSDPPSHPEVLDYLAGAFMDGGWSIKKMHRLILLSRVYQQASHDRPECQRADADNRLLWKMNRQRLDFEATRDALLAVSGRLDRRVGGPSIKDIASPKAVRRTAYAYLDRLNVPGLFRTFDFPSPDATSPGRDVTTMAPQALFLMNSPVIAECARSLSQRPDVAGAKDVTTKVQRLHELCYGRPATAEDLHLARDFLGDGTLGDIAWQRYIQALLLANEFVFID
jgi:mono/diheme cytochrome c family protein